MDITIRLVQPTDGDQIVNLINTYVKEYIPSEKIVPVHFDPEIGTKYWEEIVRNGDDEVVIVAFDKDKLVGFCIGDVHHFADIEKVYFDGDRWGELWDIYTAPTHQGNGIGSRMIKMAEEEFIKKGCKGLKLNNVSVENSGAIKLYERLGYKPYTYEFFKRLD